MKHIFGIGMALLLAAPAWAETAIPGRHYGSGVLRAAANHYFTCSVVNKTGHDATINVKILGRPGGMLDQTTCPNLPHLQACQATFFVTNAEGPTEAYCWAFHALGNAQNGVASLVNGNGLGRLSGNFRIDTEQTAAQGFTIVSDPLRIVWVRSRRVLRPE